jgi:hypothetical protein
MLYLWRWRHLPRTLKGHLDAANNFQDMIERCIYNDHKYKQRKFTVAMFLRLCRLLLTEVMFLTFVALVVTCRFILNYWWIQSYSSWKWPPSAPNLVETEPESPIPMSYVNPTYEREQQLTRKCQMHRSACSVSGLSLNDYINFVPLFSSTTYNIQPGLLRHWEVISRQSGVLVPLHLWWNP